MIKKIYILIFIVSLASCIQEKDSKINNRNLYFDLQGYFEKEVARLQKLNPTLGKTVSVNGVNESKKVKVADWKKELAIFANADINKASWQGSFNITKVGGAVVYSSNNKKIPVKKLYVVGQGAKVREIEIIIANKNILFQSNDTLHYYPDSLYLIKKQQKIRLLNEKKYTISGKFK